MLFFVVFFEVGKKQVTQLLRRRDLVPLTRSANNSRLTDAAVRVRSQFTIFTHAYREDKAARESILSEHQSIIDAVTCGDGALVEKIMREHVYRSRDIVLKTLEQENNTASPLA